MGEVFEAEQTEPIRRRVALKVIKQGMDTRAVVARFEAERQALALMDHPSIAKVFDAGATDRGRPYFVMEYVEGEPITEYCDRHRLQHRRAPRAVRAASARACSTPTRRPSSTATSSRRTSWSPRSTASRVPKIIDFGVAKATTQRLTEKTMFTELGQLIGTPEYMSPEQAAADRRRHRHAHRRLLAGRGAVRAAGRRAAVRVEGTAQGRLRRDPAHHPRAGPAAAEHAVQRPGRPRHDGGRPRTARRRSDCRANCAATWTGSR